MLGGLLMKKWLFAVLLGSAIVLGACGGGDDGAKEDNGDDNGAVDSAAAEDIFKSNCSSCHGADLSGGAGPDLTNVGADHSKDDIEDIIQNGKGGMPAQSQVTGDDLDTLASWLADKK
jgi:cytochrome c551